MTIQRITFECIGQPFQWWEVDDQTGRIVGCGPMEADVWAERVQITIRADVQIGASAPMPVGRKITSDPQDGPEDVQKAVTVALRQINDELKGLIQ